MLIEFQQRLAGWGVDDTWIVVSAALAGMACAVPGTYLLLRRQSMMGDALSHTSLLGIVLAFLFSGLIVSQSDHQAAGIPAKVHWLMFAGAVVIGILAAVLTEAIQKLGRVESSAALGVVFTTMFALGLLLMKWLDADKAHIDTDCVLYGSIVEMTLNTVSIAGLEIPRAVLLSGVILVVNLLLVTVFFKELEISTFDPELATALGIKSSLINYSLMAVTAATIVSVFESVGSIIVIAMLIVPPATAFLLTSRLRWIIPLSLLLAFLSGIFGHMLAIVVPPVLFPRLGFEGIKDASTTGMMAATSGGFFFLALVFAPKQGILSRFVRQSALSLKVAADDLLGLLYRMEEWQLDSRALKARDLLSDQLGYGKMIARLAVRRLVKEKMLDKATGEYRLTEKGKEAAQGLVRAHRLWESYMAHHFNLSDERLHQSAHRVEHYLDPSLRKDLAEELESPKEDPHGRAIPEEREASEA